MVQKNKSLRVVQIIVNPPEDVPANFLERFIEMTSCFLLSPAVQSLEIVDSAEDESPEVESPGFFDPVRELLRTKYRHRRVQVAICGTIM